MSALHQLSAESDAMRRAATDGKCHNANRGTFGHECGRPAAWIGVKPNGYHSGFCEECKDHGDEAKFFVEWERVPEAEAA